MLLGEWRRWWTSQGESELMELLTDRWDVFEDETARAAARPQLATLVRGLHEGASLVETQRSLNQIRLRHQPQRTGQKWINRDRVVARHVVIWYEGATGELREH